jgi:hypothetical protein
VKPTFWFCLLSLAGAGCVGLPNGTQDSLPKPPQAVLAEPPMPVNPEEINESNARNRLKQLEQEISFDERSEPPPEATPPPAEKEQDKQDTLKKPDKPKRSGRPWGPTWG